MGLLDHYRHVLLAHQHLRTANQALRIAAEQPAGSDAKDYAQSLAAQELKAALRADARTHIGRIGSRA